MLLSRYCSVYEADSHRMGAWEDGGRIVAVFICDCSPELGATRCYVGSDLPFYRSLGFRHCYTEERWRRS